MAKQYWLMKSEPGAYSIDDLEKDQETYWDGVRNYQARNFMRDKMRIGDEVLFYHSNAKPPGVAGLARISKEGYPDHTAFDPEDPHYDPKSDQANPRWFMVDIKFVDKFAEVIPLSVLRETEGLENMVLVKRSRLSVQPVTRDEFEIIKGLGPVG
jgi:predicted RNA-binding protein with PUA-like domain